MTNLTSEDLKRIEAIEAYLEKLTDYVGSDNGLPLFFPYQPIVEPKEVRYVRCVENQNEFPKNNLTVGKVYQLIKVLACGRYVVTDDYGDSVPIYASRFTPVTEAEYLAQQKEVEWKPEVGSWVWNNPNKTLLGLVKEFSDHKNKVYVDFQDGRFEWWHTNILCKPTPEEVETHLKAIAEKKYPAGTIFISIGYGIKNVAANRSDIQYEKGELLMNGACVWYGGKWATIVEKEVEQPADRWRVEIIDTVTGYYGIYITSNPSLRKLKAQEIADKIRNLLNEK